MHTRLWPKFLRQRLSLFLLTAFTVSILTIAIGPVTVAQTVSSFLKLDFESGTLTGWKKEACCSYSVQPNTEFLRYGRYSARFELRKTDPDISSSRRTELALKAVPKNSEYWYGFSMRFPKNWVYENSFEIVSQWHSIPDLSLGEQWLSPPFYFTTKYDKIRIVNRWDPKQVTRNNDPRPEGGIAQLWEGTFTPGAWTDWVVHAKWSHLSDGILQVWRNGQLVVDKRGPNTYNDPYGPYFKTGIYKPDWKYNPSASTQTMRSLFIDEFRMMSKADGGSYAKVAPPGTRPTTTSANGPGPISTAPTTTTTTTTASTTPTTTTTTATTTASTTQNCPTVSAVDESDPASLYRDDLTASAVAVDEIDPASTYVDDLNANAMDLANPANS